MINVLYQIYSVMVERYGTCLRSLDVPGMLAAQCFTIFFYLLSFGLVLN